MKSGYDFLLSFVLWFVITVYFGLVGIGDWNTVDYMGIFIIVYIPFYIMVKWVVVTKWGNCVNER